MSQQIPVTVPWTPELMATGARAFQKTAPKKPLIVTLALVVPVVFAVIAFGDGLGLWLRGADRLAPGSYSKGWFDGVIAYSVLIFAVLMIAARVRRAVGGQMVTESPFLSRPWTITLSVHGIRTKGPYNEGHVDWAAVTDVAETPAVIVLSLGGGGILPLPHDGLPEGTDPKAVAAQIATWREAAVF